MKIIYGLEAIGRCKKFNSKFSKTYNKMFTTLEKAAEHIEEFTLDCCSEDESPYFSCDKDTIMVVVVERELEVEDENDNSKKS